MTPEDLARVRERVQALARRRDELLSPKLADGPPRSLFEGFERTVGEIRRTRVTRERDNHKTSDPARQADAKVARTHT